MAEVVLLTSDDDLSSKVLPLGELRLFLKEISLDLVIVHLDSCRFVITNAGNVTVDDGDNVCLSKSLLNVFYPLSLDLYCLSHRQPADKYAYQQRTAVLQFIMSSDDIDGRWANYPRLASWASQKPAIASICGKLSLTFPPYIISNSPLNIKEWISHCSGQSFVKSASPSRAVVQGKAVGAFVIRLADIENDEEIAVSPLIYQQLIDAKFALRAYYFAGSPVTVVRQEILEVGYDTYNNCEQWTLEQNDLHGAEQATISIAKAAGLAFCTVDFLFENKLHVIDINPSGAWHFFPADIRAIISARWVQSIGSLASDAAN